MGENPQECSWHRVNVLPPFFREVQSSIPVVRELMV